MCEWKQIVKRSIAMVCAIALCLSTITLETGAASQSESSMSARLYGYDDIKLVWKTIGGASGYKVYYKTASEERYTYYKSTTKTTISCDNLKDGIKYQFKVVSYRMKGETKVAGKVQTAACYTLKKLSAPTIEQVSDTSVKVSWKNISGESGYQISQSTTKGATSIVTTYGTTEGAKKTLSANMGKTYYYKIRAYKTVDGERIYAPWSPETAYKIPVKYEVTSISLNETALSLQKDETFQLKATIVPKKASIQKLSWSSSDKSVVSVTQEGVLRAKSAGVATITAKAKDGSGTKVICYVAVPDDSETPTLIQIDMGKPVKPVSKLKDIKNVSGLLGMSLMTDDGLLKKTYNSENRVWCASTGKAIYCYWLQCVKKDTSKASDVRLAVKYSDNPACKRVNTYVMSKYGTEYRNWLKKALGKSTIHSSLTEAYPSFTAQELNLLWKEISKTYDKRSKAPYKTFWSAAGVVATNESDNTNPRSNTSQIIRKACNNTTISKHVVKGYSKGGCTQKSTGSSDRLCDAGFTVTTLSDGRELKTYISIITQLPGYSASNNAILVNYVTKLQKEVIRYEEAYIQYEKDLATYKEVVSVNKALKKAYEKQISKHS